MNDESHDPREPISSDLAREDKIFGSIVTQFVDGLSDRIDAMGKALDDDDFAALYNAAHQLKGTGGGYGYPLLSQRAAQLERHARNAALNDCRRAFAELKDVCARIVVSDEDEN